MKKIMICLIFALLFINAHSQENKQNSICHDLCLFFATKKIITEESIKEFENNYCSLVIIWDILKKDDFPNMPDLSKEFGVYKFDYIGSSDKDAPYILIKNGDSYKVFLLENISSIINELLKIKEEKDEVINDELFNKYLKALTEFGKDKFSVSFRLGNIQYITE